MEVEQTNTSYLIRQIQLPWKAVIRQNREIYDWEMFLFQIREIKVART